MTYRWAFHRLSAAIFLTFSSHAFASAPTTNTDACRFNVSALPSITGRIAAIYPNRYGGVGNIKLSSGLEISFPFGLEPLSTTLTLGRQVSVKGLISKRGDIVAAFALLENQQEVCATKSPPSLAFPPIRSARGKISTLLHDHDGFLNGIGLDDGTTIRFATPLPSAETFMSGQNISASGRGFKTRYGVVMIADEITIGQRTFSTHQNERYFKPGAAPGSAEYDVID